MIPLAIDARRQKYPDEEPRGGYSSLPFQGKQEVQWSVEAKESQYGAYWLKDIVV